MTQAVTTLVNNAPRAITLGALRASTGTLKGRMLPGDKLKISELQFEDLRRDPIVRALIKAGDLTDTEDAIDLDEDPTSLDTIEAAPIVRDRAGRAARIDTTFSPERAPARASIELKPTKPAVEPAQSQALAAQTSNFNTDSTIDVAPSTIATANTVGKSEADAITLINGQDDLETLKSWFALDEREAVRTAINARGSFILKNV